LNNDKGFSKKSANHPNEIRALTIYNSISHHCFARRDWKLENVANGKEIPAVPFRTEKEDHLMRQSTIFERISREITVPFKFQPKFPDILAKW